MVNVKKRKEKKLVYLKKSEKPAKLKLLFKYLQCLLCLTCLCCPRYFSFLKSCHKKHEV